MKKLICILLCLCVLFPLASCKRDQNEEKECYLSSASVIWGSRIYRIQKAKNITGNNQTYLVYSKVGENGKGGFESYDIDTGSGFFFDNPYCEYGTVTTK